MNTIIDLLFGLLRLIGKGYIPIKGNGIYYCFLGFIILYIVSIISYVKIKKCLDSANVDKKLLPILNFKKNKEIDKGRWHLVLFKDVFRYIIIFVNLVLFISLISICFINIPDVIPLSIVILMLIVIFEHCEKIKYIMSIINKMIIVILTFLREHLICKIVIVAIIFVIIVFGCIIIGTFIMISINWKENVISVDYYKDGRLQINTEIYNGKYEYEPIVIELKKDEKSISIATLSELDCHLISNTNVRKRINYPYNKTIMELKSMNKINKSYVYNLSEFSNYFEKNNRYNVIIKTNSYYDDVELCNTFIKNDDEYEFKENSIEEKYACNHGAEKYDANNSICDNIYAFIFAVLFIIGIPWLIYILLI